MVEELPKSVIQANEVLAAVAQHRFAKSDELAKEWFETVRSRLRDYKHAVIEEHCEQNEA